MCSSDDSDWPVHSLMLSFHDVRGLPLQLVPTTVLRSTIFGSVSSRETCPNDDNLRRSMVDNRSNDGNDSISSMSRLNLWFDKVGNYNGFS